MEIPQKRNLRGLLADKRFLAALAVLLLATAALVYRGAGRPTPPEPQPDGLNPALPGAATSPPKSKLELRAEGERSDRVELPGLAAMADTQRLQGTVPGGVAPYLYGPRPVAPAPEAVPPAAEPVASRLSAGNRRAAHREELPEPVEPDEMEEAPVVKPAPEATAKRQRLLALLEEYQRDKHERRQRQQADLKPQPLAAADPITALERLPAGGRNGFYGLYSDAQRREHRANLDSAGTALQAVIFGDQTVVNGGRVRLQLTQPVTLRGVVIPAGTLLYGLVQFGPERVSVRISGIRLEDRIYPVRLSVFDMDGIEGVYVPSVTGAAEGRQVLAQTAGGLSLYPGAGSGGAGAVAAATAAQAGSAGLRSYLQKKATQPKAKLNGNYYVLLR